MASHLTQLQQRKMGEEGLGLPEGREEGGKVEGEWESAPEGREEGGTVEEEWESAP